MKGSTFTNVTDKFWKMGYSIWAWWVYLSSIDFTIIIQDPIYEIAPWWAWSLGDRECTLALITNWFCWSMLCQDITNWVKTCKCCKKGKGLYNDLNVKQWSIIMNSPMDLLFSDFTTINPIKDGKEILESTTRCWNKAIRLILTWQAFADLHAKATSSGLREMLDY